MEQNKIKKGQSTWFDNFSSYWITNHNNAPIALTCDQSHEDAEATADKLVSAYNGTYGDGINPEAVPDLLAALKRLLVSHDIDTMEVTEALIQADKAVAKAAIEKSKL